MSDDAPETLPALERAEHLSIILSEAASEDFTPDPQEQEAANRLQAELVQRIRTVHYSQWPTDKFPASAPSPLDATKP